MPIKWEFQSSFQEFLSSWRFVFRQISRNSLKIILSLQRLTYEKTLTKLCILFLVFLILSLFSWKDSIRLVKRIRSPYSFGERRINSNVKFAFPKRYSLHNTARIFANHPVSLPKSKVCNFPAQISVRTNDCFDNDQPTVISWINFTPALQSLTLAFLSRQQQNPFWFPDYLTRGKYSCLILF